MTSEETQKELLDAFILGILSAKKFWRVAHANVIDSNSQPVEVLPIVKRLSDPVVLSNINNILNNNPALLEKWQEEALSGFLERDIIVNSRYAPIDEQDLLNQFGFLPKV